jgi:hypothetical protein
MVRHEIKSPILNSESLIATRSDKQYMEPLGTSLTNYGTFGDVLD